MLFDGYFSKMTTYFSSTFYVFASATQHTNVSVRNRYHYTEPRVYFYLILWLIEIQILLKRSVTRLWSSATTTTISLFTWLVYAFQLWLGAALQLWEKSHVYMKNIKGINYGFA